MRDTRPASWARTVSRLRRAAEDLKAHDFQVIEPDNLETPPYRRDGRTPAIVEVSRMGGGDIKVPPPDRPTAEEN